MRDAVYRHEYKYPINPADGYLLAGRLTRLMSPDPHAEDGSYTIRSLYFDDSRNRALWEKLDGTDPREKFRIRIYNRQEDYICVEKKVKKGELTQKLQVTITKEQCDRILTGDIGWLWRSGKAVLAELYAVMEQGMRPKTIVEYDRQPFLYGPGNVRVTIDRKIRTGVYGTNLFGDIPLVRVTPQDVLEVKYDRYLPDIIRMGIAGLDRSRSSISKYALCRQFG